MKPKRISAPPEGSVITEPSPTTTVSKFLPFLSYITDGCTVREVDPSACIPLYILRSRFDSAVRKLKALLTGEHADHFGNSNLSGMVSGSPTSVVVPLLGGLEQIIEDYLARHYINEEDRIQVKASHEVCYLVIDGCQLLRALQELKEEKPSQFAHSK